MLDLLYTIPLAVLVLWLFVRWDVSEVRYLPEWVVSENSDLLKEIDESLKLLRSRVRSYRQHYEKTLW